MQLSLPAPPSFDLSLTLLGRHTTEFCRAIAAHPLALAAALLVLYASLWALRRHLSDPTTDLPWTSRRSSGDNWPADGCWRWNLDE